MQTATAPWQGFVRSKNSHRDNRRECFCNHQAQSGLGRLQVTVESARAFWENQHGVTGVQNANDGLNRAAIDAFLINWDHIQLWQWPAEGRRVQQRSPVQNVNRPITGNPSKR